MSGGEVRISTLQGSVKFPDGQKKGRKEGVGIKRATWGNQRLGSIRESRLHQVEGGNLRFGKEERG